ncbi:MATH and LRR domain-containing protein PFE0570w isoform X1 [Onthophagus taurus]|uniref:MATH and LRR domain-containing protein PFE0570w isoform X1 n=2 Tax=Onthophagus taurus TaxID=166361 RepID=UPI0039BE3C74
MKASAQPGGREDAAVPCCKNVNKSLNGCSSTTNKPLHNYKFYLDVKNRIIASKVELKIKELGGVLELFLIKEITHVVTDREGCCSTKGGGSQPRTPQYVPHELSSNEFGTTNNEEITPRRGRPKTRADAMLERARKTPTVITKDPLEEARNWGITIWSIDKTFAFLEQVSASYKLSNKKKTTQKFFELKTPYIKFEAFNRQTRPIFQEIRNWPQLNFQGSAGDPGIVIRSNIERNMTRKTRSNPRLDTALQPGYCEVCRADYLRLDEHLESDKHLTFIKDNSNFLQLDTLISNTSSINNFLKLNGVNKLIETEPVKNKKRMLRPRTVSLCDKIRNSPLSPTGSESSNSNRLRSKRHCAAVTNYVGALIDDDHQVVKTEGVRERELRSSTRQLLKLLENEQKDTWDSGRPKRACIRQKRLSIEDSIPLENKMYYKVEVLSNKLRSSSDSSIQKEQNHEPAKKTAKTTDNHSEGVGSDKNKSLIVKFKKMRSYELRQLNNEAESFLFPKRDETTSSEEDVDADNPNTTASVGGDSTILLSSESEAHTTPKREEVRHLDEASLDSNWSECSSKKKKRRTHAEAFILDNQKYYKFETPGSRLRYHGSYLAPVATDSKSPKSSKCNGEHSSKIIKLDGKCYDLNIKGEKSDVFDYKTFEFSFERAPTCESWYSTFQRQDEGQESYKKFTDLDYKKPFLLPYEIGPLPPLDPRFCIKSYKELKKELIQQSLSTTSAGSNTPTQNQIELNEENSKESEDSSITNDRDDFDEHGKSKSGKNRKVMALGKNPRKSPRQHASTLAILSSLLHQRKRRSDNNKSSSELDKTLPTIQEKEEDQAKSVDEKEDEEIIIYKGPEGKVQEIVRENERIAKRIDEEWFNFGLLNDLELNLSEEETVLINSRLKLSAIELLNNFDDKDNNSFTPAKKLFSTAKKPWRKKKKNRTGWPNKNSKRRKEESKDNFCCNHKELNNSGALKNHSQKTKNNCNNFSDQSTTDKTKSVPIKNVNSVILDDNQVILNGNDDDQDRVLNKINKLKKQDDDNDEGEQFNSEKDDLNNKKDIEWDNSPKEKVLMAKVTNGSEVSNNDKDLLQPVVRVQKLTEKISSKKRAKSGSSPNRTVKRPRRTPPSPKSPRILRKPRGRWYRER